MNSSLKIFDGDITGEFPVTPIDLPSGKKFSDYRFLVILFDILSV